MTTTGKKLKVIFMLIILSLSNFVPLSAIADTTDDPTVLETISAEVISDQSGKKALNIKLNANNTSAEKIEKEIGLVENYLSDVERKEGDGYAYQVNSGKITLEISSNTKQTIDLSFPIDPALYHSQANKLIVDNKEYDIIDETENKKDTDVSVPKPDEIEEESSKENENSVSPFTLPTLSLPAVSVPSNQTIPTEYTTDDQGTYPKASWQPTGNTNVLDHQGNKNGTNQWDGINSWNGDPNDRTHSYIEYGGTGNQADYAIRKYAKETSTPGLFDVYLNARGNVQKDITPLDLVLVVDWSGSMNDNNRIGEVKIGVDRFVDTLADSGITDKINMGYVGYSSEGYSYSNGAVQMGSFDSVKNQVKSITPSRTNGGTFTQKALRDAGSMLSVPNGHKKVIVLLTDGVPTFSYKVQRVHAQSSSNYYGTQFSNTQDRPGNTSLISRIYDAPDQKYNLEEVKAPDNAEMIEKQTITPFEILANSQTPVEKTIKNDTSKVDKTTPQLNGKDVAIGEKIQYEISVNIPLGIADKEGTQNKYTTFKLIDTHDAALTFDNDSSGTYAYALYDGNKEIDPVNYSVTEQTDGFTVSVDPNYIPSLTPGGTLKFVYYMHLNEKADPTKGFSNQANVDNGHTNDQTPPSVDVVTGGKRFVKVDGDVTSDQTLAGAEFVVRDQDSDTAKYLSIDPSTKAVSWVSAKESATVFTTTSNGLIDVTGLKYGTYYLEETKAPEKYVPLTNRVAFTIDEQSYVTAGQLISPEKIPNKHKGTLPSTGGKGIYVYIGAGVVLLLIAGLYFARRKHSQI
ncbi:SpaH/EbpB family LPXTG-anchored major pilin [Enterococcus sp. GC37]|uniref:SpaH/EbpB family LPXTG-anchored major pilin n=1 Tax=unclassified Enterococcus TaxID=2608891 RepID=UPI0034A0423D